MNIEAVASKLYHTLSDRATIKRAGPGTIKAILVEELQKRAERYKKDPTGVMAGAAAATLRRAKEG